jgi:hypothetical protein
MIRLTITPTAFEAIAATLPGSVHFDNECAPNGDYLIWLELAVVSRLKALSGPGDSYSDAIIRVTRTGGERVQ